MVNLEVQPTSMERNISSRSELRVRSAAIIKFANMGLSGREISYAVEIETGMKISPRNVAFLVFGARGRGTIRHLTLEEKTDIARTVSNPWDYPDEIVRQDVLSILQNIKRLEEEGKPLPQNRLELAKFRIPHNGLLSNAVGVQDGQKIVFSDGRHIPTYKGLQQTDKQRRIVAERNRGRKSREQVDKLSTVWPKVKILRMRLALSSEIAEITGFTKEQVKGVIDKNGARPKWNRIPPLTPEQVVEQKRRAAKAKKPRNPKDRELPTQDEKNSLAFAKIVFDSGLVPEDLRDWLELKFIYSQNKRDFPDNFAKRLRLEVFLRARLNADNGNRELMDKYVEFGLKIDRDWFNDLVAEEEFITRTVRKKIARETLFLDEFFRLRKIVAETGDTRVLNELVLLRKQDPTITTRLSPQMAEIIKSTPIKFENSNLGKILAVHGEMSRDDVMGMGR